MPNVKRFKINSTTGASRMVAPERKRTMEAIKAAMDARRAERNRQAPVKAAPERPAVKKKKRAPRSMPRSVQLREILQTIDKG